MKKILSTLVLLTGMLMMSNTAIAEPLSINEKDDIESILKAHNGKRVTVKLNSGDELTGTVGAVNDDLVHLRELSGKEFFDAVVDTDEVSAVIIRTKE
jgi:hypothetical protein